MTRSAAGMSPEEILLESTEFEGVRAGERGHGPEMNPKPENTPEHEAWESGRRRGAAVAAARSVA